MKLTLAEPKHLKDSISIISELVSEARLKIGTDGIELVAMDPANVAMVIFKLFSSCFVEYEVPKETKIGLNLSNFKQVLKRAKQNDIISLDIDKGMLKIKFKSNTIREFSLPIIDIEEGEQKIPQLNFPVSITTESSILSDAIEDASIVADSVSFIVEDGKFIISAEGDMNKVNIEIKQGENTNIVTETQEKIKAKYSVEYLKKLTAGSKLSDSVIVRLNTDYPLKLEYNEVDKVSLAFILAPRVDND